MQNNTTYRLKDMVCSNCGCDHAVYIETPELQHTGKMVCVNCDTFIKWVHDQDKPLKRKVARLRPEINYCEMCLQNEKDLPNKIVLHEHHILEYQHRPELDNDPDNRLVLCSNCHNIIHAIRKMFNINNI